MAIFTSIINEFSSYMCLAAAKGGAHGFFPDGTDIQTGFMYFSVDKNRNYFEEGIAGKSSA